jgi:hypothetical protein
MSAMGWFDKTEFDAAWHLTEIGSTDDFTPVTSDINIIASIEPNQGDQMIRYTKTS